ncbi:MAG TPA: DUF4886 domain-containing protein [Opitutales bacterium]|nr:DUF4886 domain-containing protein [Opitutales bacterium]
MPLLTADSPAKASEAAYRTWTSFTGSSIEAKLVKQNPGNAVTLRKKDGSTLFVDFRQLSPQDRKYLQELAALEGRPERILFIGNSYTGGVRGMLTKLLAASPYKGCHLGFVTPGGRTLKQHLENESTMQKVREGDWHVVVLQDQSQTPAVFPDKFMEAARAIDDIIDDSGAQTVFFETWGRRDGDKMNLHLFPNYETMQEALSESYAKAARKCGAGLAPVGQAWKILRETYPEIGIKLYTGDGSHPSGIGAYLAACVFYATLFDADPTEVDFGGGLPEEQVEAIHAAVLEIME